MKLTHIFAAALMIAGVGVSTEASAQRHDGYGQNDRGEHRFDRHDDRRHYGRDDRRRHGANNYRRCRTEYRHHRRVRICR